MKISIKTFAVAAALVLTAQSASAALIGWETFESFNPSAGAPNDVGINDTTPEVNTSNGWLSGAVGHLASSGNNGNGFRGYGLNTTASFLNDGVFGASGDATSGAAASSWKFIGQFAGQRQGDFLVTNESAHFFQIEFFHYDARRAAANSADTLELRYTAGPGNLINKNFGTEVQNGAVLNTTTFASPSETDVTRNPAAALSSKVFLAPGESASFRFVWSGHNANFAQSQIDNLAIEGSFFETSALLIEVDPSAVPLPAGVWLFGSALAGLFARKRLGK